MEELKEMVSNINQQQVEPADRLSDNVYQFDGKKLSWRSREEWSAKPGSAAQPATGIPGKTVSFPMKVKQQETDFLP